MKPVPQFLPQLINCPTFDYAQPNFARIWGETPQMQKRLIHRFAVRPFKISVPSYKYLHSETTVWIDYRSIEKLFIPVAILYPKIS